MTIYRPQDNPIEPIVPILPDWEDEAPKASKAKDDVASAFDDLFNN